MATKKKPTHEIWFGAVRATIWTNISSTGERWHSATISRRYKDDEGHWQDSHAYTMRHLPDLAQTVAAANLWIEQHTDTPEMRAIVHELVGNIADQSQNSARRAS